MNLNLASKKGQLTKNKIIKIRTLYTTNWMILFWLSYTTFLFDLFLETVSRAEILEKICWFFGRFEDTKSRDIQLWPKGHFEINWPLGHLREVNGSKIKNLDLKKKCVLNVHLYYYSSVLFFRKVEILVWDSYILAE